MNWNVQWVDASGQTWTTGLVNTITVAQFWKSAPAGAQFVKSFVVDVAGGVIPGTTVNYITDVLPAAAATAAFQPPNEAVSNDPLPAGPAHPVTYNDPNPVPPGGGPPSLATVVIGALIVWWLLK